MLWNCQIFQCYIYDIHNKKKLSQCQRNKKHCCLLKSVILINLQYPFLLISDYISKSAHCQSWVKKIKTSSPLLNAFPQKLFIMEIIKKCSRGLDMRKLRQTMAGRRRSQTLIHQSSPPYQMASIIFVELTLNFCFNICKKNTTFLIFCNSISFSKRTCNKKKKRQFFIVLFKSWWFICCQSNIFSIK